MGCGISHRKNENRENLIHTNCGIIRVFKGTLVGLDVRATEFSLKRARQACKSIRFATVRGFGAGIRSNFKRGSKKNRNFENIPYFERSSDQTGSEVVLPPAILILLELNFALEKAFTPNNYFTINR